ncbi:MAG TPA: hypothetical protein PLK08_02895 [Phycisphaerae bacterium]|nr:hypothetical protein [Phycisphaerae bacterium]
MTHMNDTKDGRFPLRGYSPPLLKPRGPIRVILATLVNLLLFTVAAGFFGYLSSGKPWDFSSAAYRKDLLTPFAEFLLEPVGIFSQPWMILVYGVLLGILIFVPVAVSVLFQLLLSMVFVLIVGGMGHSWIFALSLAIGCVIAARTRLRRSWPFGAMLLGMTPSVLFLYFLAFPSLDSAVLLPIQRWILILCLTLGVVIAAVFCGICVALVRWRKFQPGVIWPMLLGGLLTGFVIFWVKVGPAEVDYALLTSGLADSQSIFPAQSAERWQKERHKTPSKPYILLILENLESRKAALIRRCNGFLNRYPDSRRAASVAFLRAQLECVQLDLSIFDERFACYTAEFVNPDSYSAWLYLLEKYPTSDSAAMAYYNIGILKLRQAAGKANLEIRLNLAHDANGMLWQAQDRLRDIVVRLRHDTDEKGIFQPLPDMPDFQTYENALFDVEKLTWMLNDNDILSNPKSTLAMARLLSINPCSPNYVREVKRLAADESFRDTPIWDNLQLAVAKLNPNPYDRAEAIARISAKPHSDAAIEANYELGCLSMQKANASFIRLVLKEPEYYFTVVVSERFNPWLAKAARQLEWLHSNVEQRLPQSAEPSTHPSTQPSTMPAS